MFTHPDLIGFTVRQHVDELIAEAEHGRVLSAALHRRRQARAATKAARHAHDSRDDTPAPEPARTSASANGGRAREVSSQSPRSRFSSDGDVNLSACEPREAA